MRQQEASKIWNLKSTYGINKKDLHHSTNLQRNFY